MRQDSWRVKVLDATSHSCKNWASAAYLFPSVAGAFSPIPFINRRQGRWGFCLSLADTMQQLSRD